MTNTLTTHSENTSLMLEPTNVAEAMNLAGLLAKSSLIPGNFRDKPDDILVAMMWSRNLGLPVLQGMQNIAVINGRPSIWGDAALAVVRRSGLLESFKETITGQGDQMMATCRLVRKGDVEPYEFSFSVLDAKLARLWGKQGPWSQYPKRMLQLRARGFALRNAFPDVLMGVGIREEEQDTEDAKETELQQAKKIATTVEPVTRSSVIAPARKSQQIAPEIPQAIVKDPAEPVQSFDLFGEQAQPVPSEPLETQEMEQEITDNEVEEAKLRDRLEACQSIDEMKQVYLSLTTEQQIQYKSIFSEIRARKNLHADRT